MLLVSSFSAKVLTFLVLFKFASSSDLQCLSRDADPYQKFSTKTSYGKVREPNVLEDDQPGCRSVKLWMTARHGTRYPSTGTIATLASRLPKIRDFVLEQYGNGASALCEEDMALLRNWSMQFDPSDGNDLTPAGHEELYQLAKRLQHRFPHLLPNEYSPERYDFLSTRKRRALKSSRSFARGLFGSVPRDLPQPAISEPLLQFYRPCPTWKQQVEHNQRSRHERNSFQNSSVMRRTITAVSRRVGHKDDLLSFSDVELMYNVCRYENAIYPDRVSVWCSFFSRDDLRSMEFYMDLHYYWMNSFGHALNYKPACIQVKDFLSKFTQFSANGDGVSAHLYFSHLGGVLRFITRLGLFNDSRALLHDNFGGDHMFRSSHLAPFSSNVVLVLYRCQDTEYYVRALVQERDVLLPGCSGLLCPLDHLMKHYSTVVDECDVSSICGLAEVDTSWVGSLRNTALAILSTLAIL